MNCASAVQVVAWGQGRDLGRRRPRPHDGYFGDWGGSPVVALMRRWKHQPLAQVFWPSWGHWPAPGCTRVCSCKVGAEGLRDVSGEQRTRLRLLLLRAVHLQLIAPVCGL